jgi:hypothetical protein
VSESLIFWGIIGIGGKSPPVPLQLYRKISISLLIIDINIRLIIHIIELILNRFYINIFIDILNIIKVLKISEFLNPIKYSN